MGTFSYMFRDREFKGNDTSFLPKPYRPSYAESREIANCNVALQMASLTLDPSEISNILGIQPSKAWKKGDRVFQTGDDALQQIGMWQ